MKIQNFLFFTFLVLICSGSLIINFVSSRPFRFNNNKSLFGLHQKNVLALIQELEKTHQTEKLNLVAQSLGDTTILNQSKGKNLK